MSRNKKKNYYRKMNKKPKQVMGIPDDYAEDISEEAEIPENTGIPEEAEIPENTEVPEEAEIPENMEVPEGSGEVTEELQSEPEEIEKEAPEAAEESESPEEEPVEKAEEQSEETAGEEEETPEGEPEIPEEAAEETEEESEPEPEIPEEAAEETEEEPEPEVPEKRASEKRTSERRTPERRKSTKQKTVYRPERYNVLFVSEDGRDVRSFRTSSDFLMLLAVLAALIVIGVIGYVLYTVGREDEFIAKNEALQEELKSLSEDIIVLEADKEELENELRVANALLETGMAKHEDEGKPVNLKAIPAGLPVNGAVALPSQYSAEKQYITFMTGGGSKVVASGEGTVIYAGESVEFGYAVKIDHGNGYVTTYYEDTPPAVKEGVSVKRGDTLYVVEADNQTLTYQIAYEDQFIDPYTVMDIDG